MSAQTETGCCSSVIPLALRLAITEKVQFKTKDIALRQETKQEVTAPTSQVC